MECTKCHKEKPETEYYSKQNFCKECAKEKSKIWREKNKDRNKANKKAWKKNNPELLKAEKKRWYSKNKDRIAVNIKTYVNKRKKEDSVFNLKIKISRKIGKAISASGFSKSKTTHKILGCTSQFFKDYIESKWESWMSWDNYGLYDGTLNYGWDLDHIVPISRANSEEELLRLNHYTNFQPLCSYTNRYIKKDS